MTRQRNDLPAQAVLARLGWGHDHARSLSAIAEQMKAPRRAVELAVHALRLDGFPVCSDGSGVWLGDRADLAATIASLQRRLRQQYLTLRALRRARDRMVGEQLTWLDVA
jgi:biotin operon repressor